MEKGFSLVEISIVLVIIGLLAGSVMVGRDMIRAAELRTILSEKDKVQAAVMVFQEKYEALPGDMLNATAFWGIMPTGTCSTTAAGASGGTGTQTCNGNGDGIINYILVNNSNTEISLFWQHLGNAGLIEGQYTGRMTGWGVVNEWYFSKLKPNWYHIFDNISDISDIYTFEGNQRASIALRPIDITPTEAYGMDKKIDDGLPGLGDLTTQEASGVNCNNIAPSTTTAIAHLATYNLAFNGNACQVNFRNLW